LSQNLISSDFGQTLILEFLREIEGISVVDFDKIEVGSDGALSYTPSGEDAEKIIFNASEIMAHAASDFIAGTINFNDVVEKANKVTSAVDAAYYTGDFRSLTEDEMDKIGARQNDGGYILNEEFRT
jgi:hypothetical protein